MRPYMVLLALAGVFSSALAGCQRGYTNSYASYAEADQAGAIDRGWVPEFLPRDASNITESHDGDAGRIAIAFDAQENAFLAQFAALPRDQVSGAAEIAARTALAKEVRGISGSLLLSPRGERHGIVGASGRHNAVPLLGANGGSAL